MRFGGFFYPLIFLIITLLPTAGICDSAENNIEIPEIPVSIGASIYQEADAQYLALHFKNEPHWHTYWTNPGDAGLTIKVQFSKGEQQITVSEMERPVPRRFIESGNMWAYGHEAEYSLFYDLTRIDKSELESGLTLKANWLVCRHICIPGNISFDLKIKNQALQTSNVVPASIFSLNVDQQEIARRFKALPKAGKIPTYLDIILSEGSTPGSLVLYYNLSEAIISNLDPTRNLLTPYDNPLFSFKHEVLHADSKGNIYAKMEIDWEGQYQEPSQELPSDGKFSSPQELKFIFADPRGKEITTIKKVFSGFTKGGAKSMESFFTLVPELKITGQAQLSSDTSQPQPSTTATSRLNFFYFVMAFLGGLILNFMPCVLPIISLKLFGLIKYRDSSPGQIFRHNIFYSLGVIVTFLILGLAVVTLKSAGQTVGWGFQLQSPYFVAAMIIALFVFTLNLFGMFELGIPGGSLFGNLSIKEGVVGDFLSGVLATILSTPCSAPFLGTALTFAFTHGSLEIIFTFLFIGLGLSFPFLLTGPFPGLIKFLPHPGKWMEDLKKFLGLTLLMTIVWLIDVYLGLTDGGLPIIKLNMALLFTFFAFYVKKNITRNKYWQGLFFLIPIVFLFSLFTTPMSGTKINAGQSNLIVDKRNSGLPWVPFTPSHLEELKLKQIPVFLDFTAKWCFTCKVNEKLVIETNDFKQFVISNNIRLMLGDWTKRDDRIGNWLREHGKVGVPAYFVLNKKGELVSLGETISLSEIKQAFEID